MKTDSYKYIISGMLAVLIIAGILILKKPGKPRYSPVIVGCQGTNTEETVTPGNSSGVIKEAGMFRFMVTGVILQQKTDYHPIRLMRSVLTVTVCL